MEKLLCISRGCCIYDEDGTTLCQTRNSCNKLDVHDWLGDIPESLRATDIVEVRFKNTRKGFYVNASGGSLMQGDIVAVEASPGHDIGTVSLTGELIFEHMKKYAVNPKTAEFKKVYRKAKPADLQKWRESIALEHRTMIKARQIARKLNLDMKIGDVEYQGDKTKAIFYYIADDRVDFRELIKVLAEEFKVRIEMRQIGARQEAGKIGGIGACGRELCCATFISNFMSVTTNAARYQELSLNPQKLAGQCSKLKCCLNYEVDVYLDARKDFPDRYETLETQDATLYHQKTDIFKREMWYSQVPNSPVNMFPLTVDKVKEIIELNKQGKKAAIDLDGDKSAKKQEPEFANAVGEDSLTRFDSKKRSNNSNNNKRKKRKPKRPDNAPRPPQAQS